MEKIKMACKHSWCFDGTVYQRESNLPYLLVILIGKYDKKGRRFYCNKCGDEKIVWLKEKFASQEDGE